MNILHIVSIICFALCILMFFYFKWYIKKRVSSSGLDERQTEVRRLIADIDRITDRDSQLVEERINKLRAIIEDADKRIAVYVKELEKSKTSEAMYKSLGQGIRDALEIKAESETEQTYPQDTIKLSTEAQFASQSAQQFASQSTLQDRFSEIMEIPSVEEKPDDLREPKREADIPVTPPSRQQIRARIDMLVNEGLSSLEIASRLGISIAEVNLAMNLRRR